MRKSSPLLATVALAIGLVAGTTGCGGTGGASGVPRSAAAVVGNEEISKAALAALVAITKRQYAVKKAAFPKSDTAAHRDVRYKALHYLVLHSELEQKLRKLGVNPVTAHDVDVKLAAVKKRLFGKSQSAYTHALASTGLTEADAKAELHDRLVEARLFAHVNAGATVSDLELQRYYISHKTQYGRPATRQVRYILVATEALATKIAGQLRSGAEFAALAQRYSKNTASANVGDAITISQGNSIAELARAAFRLKIGGISQPVRTRYGWNIVEAVGPVHPGKFTPLPKIAGELRATILKAKKQVRWTAFLAQMEKEFAGSVHYQAGYAPTTS